MINIHIIPRPHQPHEHVHAKGFTLVHRPLRRRASPPPTASRRTPQPLPNVELDGDEVRTNLPGSGFSKEDRDTNIRRIGYVAKLLSRNGVVAITAAISPYRDVRDEIRAQTPSFVEVYAECPVAKLAERDVKGLYKKALAGEIKNFTGVSDPYEAPVNPEISVRTDRETVDESLDKILS